jgi:uncharacterized protein YfeS
VELFACSYDLAKGKPWATGVVESALSHVNDALFPVAADFRFNVAVCFTEDAAAIPRLVIHERPTTEWIHVTLFFPVANWQDRQSARPLAASAIVSCLFDAGTRVGVNPDTVLRYADDAGIDINVAETTSVTDSIRELDLAVQFPDLDSLFTSTIDECGPLGNDTGADILELYREWRADHQDECEFLDAVLRRWDVQYPVAAEITETALSQHSYHIMTYDDAVIGLAFAQYFVDGSVQEFVREQCLSAIERQSMPIVIRHRGWTSTAERLDALARMKAFIERIDG